MADFLQQHGPVTLLTGAGLSTDSGIPDYRDAKGAWKRNPPVQHRDFMTSHAVRQRYWARSLVGWPLMQQARPNTAHLAITRLQQNGLVEAVITQNVDGLHQQAGTETVIDLHGRAGDVICMTCDYRCPRLDVHERCSQLNPEFLNYTASVAPDGDADLDVDFSQFRVASCPRCDGVLKPDVVYFGDNVPAARVAQANQALAQSGGLLVVGSSLMVFSGYRFCRTAAQAGKPLALLSHGQTRADELATLKLDLEIGPTLALTQNLCNL
ncbi:NAD-dependent protein deacetylase [Aliidiomarina sp. Khilg15.8]